MLDIDFFAQAREYRKNKGNGAPSTAPVTPIPVKPVTLEKPKPLVETPKETKTLELFPEIKGFIVSEDCKTLTYKGIEYTIPDYYNKEMIAQRDKKTLDMVFISLGLEY